MAWQRLTKAAEVTAAFPPAAVDTQIMSELAPRDGEPVFEKLGMSALVGTPLEAALRDRSMTTIALVGAVLEIGSSPPRGTPPTSGSCRWWSRTRAESSTLQLRNSPSRAWTTA